jgi:hypothetical protein
LVTTFFDQNADFGAIRTFAMPDEVIEREGSQPIDQAAKDLILREVIRNMAALGYQRELQPETNGADVVVLVTANQTTTRETWVSYPWWGGWGFWPGWGGWCCFGPGWGWSYPWVATVQYTTGSVFIDMVDPNKADQGTSVIPVVWGAGIDGLVSGSPDNSRIVSTIGQAFRQSPYLGVR